MVESIFPLYSSHRVHFCLFGIVFQITETNLPSEASIELPKVHVSAEYVQQDTNKQSEAQFAGTS